MDVIESFESLGLKGHTVDTFFFRTWAKVSLELSSFNSSKTLSEDKELVFLRVLDMTVNASGRPWFGYVQDFKAYTSSSYLLAKAERKETLFPKVETLVHFNLICNQGTIDVIAESFELLLVQRTRAGTFPKQRGH